MAIPTPAAAPSEADRLVSAYESWMRSAWNKAHREFVSYVKSNRPQLAPALLGSGSAAHAAQILKDRQGEMDKIIAEDSQ